MQSCQNMYFEDKRRGQTFANMGNDTTRMVFARVEFVVPSELFQNSQNATSYLSPRRVACDDRRALNILRQAIGGKL